MKRDTGSARERAHSHALKAMFRNNACDNVMKKYARPRFRTISKFRVLIEPEWRYREEDGGEGKRGRIHSSNIFNRRVGVKH